MGGDLSRVQAEVAEVVEEAEGRLTPAWNFLLVTKMAAAVVEEEGGRLLWVGLVVPEEEAGVVRCWTWRPLAEQTGCR